MGFMTRLPGSVLTTKEGAGTGKKLVLAAVLLAALAIVLRRRGSNAAVEDADSTTRGIDQIRTDDDDDADAGESGDEEARADAETFTEDDDDDVVEVTTGADDGDPTFAPLEIDAPNSLDLFDLVSIVGAAYKAAKKEYEERRTIEA